ncbi:MAG: hypothetical protein ABR969_08170 [Sedimentisphaerales bacterium]|jgi:hypothetical protein
MSNRKVVTVILLGVALSVLVGWGTPPIEMKLNLAPKSETLYKVVTGSAKDYQFIQPSINKTKERHTSMGAEMVFAQNIESVDKQGNATANITIKELKYLSQGSEGVITDFNSLNEKDKSDPLLKLVGASYKIKISPRGTVEVLDASAARAILKEGSAAAVATRLFSDEEIARRHQVMALFDSDKCQNPKDRAKSAKAASSNKKSDSKASKKVSKGPCKKGYQWSSLTASPAGMLRPKTFEKVYTLSDLKMQNKQTIAIVDMNAVPSSKRAENMNEKEQQAMSYFSNMFDEKDNYTGKMAINLTTGAIDSYQETLKVEWLAAENPDEQKSDKDPDQLTMGFTYIYSIKKVN